MADQHGVTRKSKLSIKTINRQVKALELAILSSLFTTNVKIITEEQLRTIDVLSSKGAGICQSIDFLRICSSKCTPKLRQKWTMSLAKPKAAQNTLHCWTVWSLFSLTHGSEGGRTKTGQGDESNKLNHPRMDGHIKWEGTPQG